MKAGLIAGMFSIGILFLTGMSGVGGDEMPRVTAEDGKTARMVAELLTARHVHHPVIDDTVSERLLTRYIDSWDPQRLYFLQSDIDVFNESKHQLDDQILAGNVEFASVVPDRYLERMKERQTLIQQLVDQDHDFTIDEDIMLDRDSVSWAQSEEELVERWRKQVKFELLQLQFGGMDLTQARRRIHDRYRRNLAILKQTERYELMESYLTVFAQCVDPYARYFSPETMADYRGGMMAYYGIGIELRDENGAIVVQNIMNEGAAQRHGKLTKGDRIIGVDPDGPSKDKELIDVTELRMSKVYENIRGDKETLVILQVEKRNGAIESHTMERGSLHSRERKVQDEIIDVSNWIDNGRGKIGVVNIPAFVRDFRAQATGKDFQCTSREVRALLDRFREQEVDALILDLRGIDPGALSAAVDLAGLFVPKGPFVQVRVADGGMELYSADDAELNWVKPLVVICDRNSKLPAEVFAGAIKDYRRGIIVGDSTSRGIGTVQSVNDVHDGVNIFAKIDRGAVKLTAGVLYRINGKCIESNGIPSDVVLPSILNHFNKSEVSWHNPLSFEAIPPVEYTPLNDISEELIQKLNQKSQLRISNNEEFRELQTKIDRWIELKNRPTASLQEGTFQIEETARREFDDALDRVTGPFHTDEDPDIFVHDAYNQEVVHITLDYLELLQSK